MNARVFRIAVCMAAALTALSCGFFVDHWDPLHVWAPWARAAVTATDNSELHGAAVDSQGNVYAAGYIRGNDDFAFAAGEYVLGGCPGSNAVLIKYDGDGVYQWAKVPTAGMNCEFLGAAADAVGGVYAAGHMDGSGLYTFAPGMSAQGDSAENALIVKYSAEGAAQWVRSVTGGMDTRFMSVCVDASGNVYAAGSVWGTGVITLGPGVTVQGASASGNCLLVCYAADGTALWARSTTAGSALSSFTSVAAGAPGRIYAAGYMNGTGTYGFPPSVSISGTCTTGNALLVCWDSTGSAQWARSTTGGAYQTAFLGVAADSGGNAYAAGFLLNNGTEYFGSGVSTDGASTSYNALTVAYDPDGTAQWAKSTTEGGESYFYSLSLDPTGGLFAVGYQDSAAAVGYGAGVSIPGNAGYRNAALVKYDIQGMAQWGRGAMSQSDETWFNAAAADASGNVACAGSISLDGAFSFGAGMDVQSPFNGVYNAVVVKYLGR